MRKFAGEWVSAVLTRLGMQEGEAIESKMVSRRIEGAQKKVEERNFDIRKNLLEYDEVMDEQRKRVYSFRQGLLEGSPPKEMIIEMIDGQIEDAGKRFLADDYGAASFAEWVGQRLGVELTARDFKGASSRMPKRSPRPRPSATCARRFARRWTKTSRPMPIPPNGPGKPWRTGPMLASSSISRIETSRNMPSTDGDEFQFGQQDLEEFLNEKANESLEKFDLSPAKRVSLARLGASIVIRLGPPQVRHDGRSGELGRHRSRGDHSAVFRTLSRDLYSQKEAELPTRIALIKYLGDRSQSPEPALRPDGTGRLGERAATHAVIEEEELRPLLRPEIEERLIGLAHQNYQGARLAQELEAKLAAAKLAGSSPDKNGSPPDPGGAGRPSLMGRRNP